MDTEKSQTQKSRKFCRRENTITWAQIEDAHFSLAYLALQSYTSIAVYLM